MTKFEDRLWREIVHKHGADLAEIEGHQVRRARTRPRVLAGTTVGLALAGVASVLVLSAASSPSAFAVSRNADGTVTVKLQRIAAIHGANAKLAALGIRARLVEVVPGCQVKALPPAAAQAMNWRGAWPESRRPRRRSPGSIHARSPRQMAGDPDLSRRRHGSRRHGPSDPGQGARLHQLGCGGPVSVRPRACCAAVA